MHTFSYELIEAFRAYWLQRYGEQIASEQAEQYLNSLAELYLAFAGIDEQTRPPAALGPRGRIDSSYPCSLNTQSDE
ncbi:hypothetical protein A2662_02375 [Candidatus Giovannonibacteria bacterium RIFCSPHIGHO2_01_FULL_45_33]|nr:MAG: hypothetical protein A2662_02375 [Candidatus Giovannonibacteria bacterium RIFCSPHIGHO2_01_FULL_45_33]